MLALEGDKATPTIGRFGSGKKANIEYQKACLDATFKAIQIEKEAKSAMATADVLESVVTQFDITEPCEELEFLNLQASSVQKVCEYINKQVTTPSLLIQICRPTMKTSLTVMLLTHQQ